MSTLFLKRSLSDCYYAAGIALARWYFGFPAAVIEVARPTGLGHEVPRGAASCESGILITGSSSAPKASPDDSGLRGAELEWQRRCGIILAETELIILACGYRAPVRQRGQCGVELWRRRRPIDHERAEALANRLAGDPALSLELACVRARALLSASSSKSALKWLASDFAEHGRLDTNQIHERCGNDLGALGPAHATWSQSWPPSLEQLQEAYIPYLDVDEEDLIDHAYEAHQALVAAMGYPRA